MSGSTTDLYDSLGALYLGATITMSLWGIATLQTYYYYNRYVKDAIWIKALVLLIWTFDTVQQALILKAGYVYLVVNYGKPQSLANSEPSITDSAIFSLLVIMLAHLFLLYRIWTLSRRNIKLVTIIGAFITTEIVVTTMELYKTFNLKQLADLQSYTWLLKLCFSAILVADTLIAATLIVLLHRSRTGFRKSDNIINRLLVFTVNTGAIPTILSILVIIMVQIYPNNMIYLSLYFFVSKVYTNTLLATLNAREHDNEAVRSTMLNSVQGITRATDNSMSMTIQVETVSSKRIDNTSLEELQGAEYKVNSVPLAQV